VFGTLYEFPDNVQSPMTRTWPKPIIQSLPDQVAQTILKRIATGELRPGHRLPSQRGLAASMGVGLAVIREAVQRLQALNIVEASHGSGTVIRPFHWIPLIYDPTLFALAVQRIGVHDLWETRRLLEGQVIRLAVERATRANLDAMRMVIARALPLPADYEASQKLNRDFHLALARASQNGVLEDLIAPLLELHTEGVDHRFTQQHCHRTWEAHQAIYDAVAARDLAAADKAIVEHFEVGPIALAEVEARSRHIAAVARRKKPPADAEATVRSTRAKLRT
jgi:GntR family transcriptional regulator, transcriptional repressor for pyruvate dehydrogenase complex